MLVRFQPGVPLYMRESMKYFDPVKAEKDTWDALIEVGAFEEGTFLLGSGVKETLKVNTERLYDDAHKLSRVMGHFAIHPSFTQADVLIAVPGNMSRFFDVAGAEYGKKVAIVKRREHAVGRRDFEFASDDDKAVAENASSPLIGHDVVRGLGSVAAVRRILPQDGKVNSLAILRIAEPHDNYRRRLNDAYLVERNIPPDAERFKKLLEEGKL